MKTGILKAGALALLISLSGVALGNEKVNDDDKSSIKTEKSSTLEVAIFPRDNGMVAVNFRKKQNETVTVKIYEVNGEQIFDEKISDSQLVGRRYDLSNLPDGYYYFEVSNDNYLVKQLVDKQN